MGRDVSRNTLDSRNICFWLWQIRFAAVSCWTFSKPRNLHPVDNYNKSLRNTSVRRSTSCCNLRFMQQQINLGEIYQWEAINNQLVPQCAAAAWQLCLYDILVFRHFRDVSVWSAVPTCFKCVCPQCSQCHGWAISAWGSIIMDGWMMNWGWTWTLQ